MVVSRDVVFDEMAAWDWEDQGAGEAAGVSSTFAVEHLVIQGGGDDGAREQAAAGEQAPPAAAHSPPPQSPTTTAQGTPPLEFASPPIDIDEFVDAFHDGEEVRFRRVDNFVGEGGAPGLASRLLNDPELLLVSAEEPPTFTVAENDRGQWDMGAGGSTGGLQADRVEVGLQGEAGRAWRHCHVQGSARRPWLRAA